MGEALTRLLNASALLDDFNTLTAFGGRLVGSPSEAAACDWLGWRLLSIPNVSVDVHTFTYPSWKSAGAALELFQKEAWVSLACHPLYWSGQTPIEGLVVEIVNVGRGSERDFSAVGHELAGKIAVVQHEYPFSSQTVHRRVKYNSSRARGAAGFIIVNNNPGDTLVGGSCGQDEFTNIPALGVSLETGALLVSAPGATVRMRVASVRKLSVGKNFIGEVPGQTAEWVTLCAHYDGHDLAQSALDNATGVAAAISIFESFGPYVSNSLRGLRLVLFTAEETGLLGSRLYLQSLAASEREAISVLINLDTLAGESRLTCLTSDFPELETFVAKASAEFGLDLRCYRPLLRNSDHFNFAEGGIPALRVLAGFDAPEATARFILTGMDTRAQVPPDQLRTATASAGALVLSALNWPGPIAAHRPQIQ